MFFDIVTNPVFKNNRNSSLSSNKLSLFKYNYMAFREINIGVFLSVLLGINSAVYSLISKFYWFIKHKKSKKVFKQELI